MFLKENIVLGIIRAIWNRTNNKILTFRNYIKFIFRKLLFVLHYIFIYFIISLFLFLLVIPVLNISPIIMVVIIILGAFVAYFYKSKKLNLTLISLWLAFTLSCITYHFLYNGNDSAFIIELFILTCCIFFPMASCMMISHINEVKEPNKKLYRERELDLKDITHRIKEEDVSILGIESYWGMGKTLIIDHFMYREKEQFSYIRIDTIALNLDDVIEYLILQITAELENQYIFSIKSRHVISYINNFKYGRLVSDLLGDTITYSSELEAFKKSIRKLYKPIIIIFEDLDRIDDKNILRKIFYMSERLTNDLNGKIKIIYQYSAEELNKKGFDNYYLQKYIHHTISLTYIPFMKLFNYIVADSSEKYESVLNYEQIIANMVNPITNWYEYSKVVINPFKKERYLKATYNIRNIEFFISNLASGINKFSNVILENKGFEKVLIQSCYIKSFLQKYYQTISTQFDLRSNFVIEIQNEFYFIWDIITVDDEQSIPLAIDGTISTSEINALFSSEINPINFEMFIAYCVLELYLYKAGIKQSPSRMKTQNLIEYKHNSLPYELNKDLDIKLNRLQHYFYTCIAAGNEVQIVPIAYANKFIDEILKADIKDIAMIDKSLSESFEKVYWEDEVFLGLDMWAAIFKSFYYASLNFKKDTTIEYYDELISLFFKWFDFKYKGKFNLELFKNLNLFLSGIQNYDLKRPFLTMMKLFDSLTVGEDFFKNIYFNVFQHNIIRSLVLFEYIDEEFEMTLSQINTSINEEFDSYIRQIYNDIIDKNKLISDELRNNREYDCSTYLKEVEVINRFIKKLNLLNTKMCTQENHNINIEEKFDGKKFLSNEQLAACIQDNSIGVVHLYDELKRRRLPKT